ncbi:MAG: hypothetical protein ACREJM_15895 [Candidatus Saccharimonadales bacterium]
MGLPNVTNVAIIGGAEKLGFSICFEAIEAMLAGHASSPKAAKGRRSRKKAKLKPGEAMGRWPLAPFGNPFQKDAAKLVATPLHAV